MTRIIKSKGTTQSAKLRKLSRRNIGVVPRKQKVSVKKKTPKKEKRKYFPEIDLLKAAAAAIVILIHILSRYKGDSDQMFLFWDLIHFSVGIFVIVSGFLYANHPADIKNWDGFVQFMWKKFKRIVIPYYIFAFIFVLFVGLFGDKSFSEFLNVENISKTLLLWGGVGNNWIPRLFISIMLVVAVESWLSKWIKQVSTIIFALSIAGSIYVLTRDLDVLSKFNNLPGWLVIFYMGRYVFQHYKWRTFLTLTAICLTVTAFLYLLLEQMGLTLSIFNNKYPPNLYFVTYNVAASLILWYVLYMFRDVAQRSSRVWGLIRFMSLNSYEIFFYHLLIMEFWTIKINPLVDWILITAMTLLFISVYRWFMRILSQLINRSEG